MKIIINIDEVTINQLLTINNHYQPLIIDY